MRTSLAAASIVLLGALGAILWFEIDISAARDFASDATVRDAQTPDHLDSLRYLDPSPSSIWLSSDWHVWQTLRDRTLPLWDRTQGGGYSPVVGWQNGVFHPLRWIVAAVPRDAAPSVLIVLGLYLAFAGMLTLLGTEIGQSPFAAVIGAVAFAFSPASMSFVQFSGALLPIAHLPWLVLFSRRRSVSSLFALTMTLALLLLSGHPLMIFAVSMAFGGVIVADAVNERDWRPIKNGVLAAVLAVGLAAFVLLPPILTASDSWTYKTRTEVGMPYRVLPSGAWLVHLAASVFDVHRPKTCCIDSAPFFLFIGLPAIALAVIGAIALRRDPTRRSFPVLLVLFWSLALPGPWMAPLASLRPLSFLKWWYLAPSFAFFLAIAAGSGLDSLLNHPTRAAKGIGVALAAALALMYARRAEEVLAPQTWHSVDRGAALDFLRSQPGPFRITALWGATHRPNASRITGIEDVRLAAPVIPTRHMLWWQAVDPHVAALSYPTVRITDNLAAALVGDFNVAFVLQSRLPYAQTFHMIPDPKRLDTTLSPQLNDRHFPLALRTPSLEIRRINATVHPRAHFAQRVISVASLDDAFQRLASDRQLAATTAVVESDSSFSTTGTNDGEVALTYPDERHVQMHVRSGAGGLVVLHDSYAPGWTATVDGRSASILPVNILSRGVIVVAGAHTIEMSYMPPGFIAGLIVSGLTLVLLVLVTYRRGTSSAADQLDVEVWRWRAAPAAEAQSG